jgi:hypothetical protein
MAKRFDDGLAVECGLTRNEKLFLLELMRELQRAAIVTWVVSQGHVMNDLRDKHIDALLDQEPQG